VIFQSANEINQTRLIKERIAEIEATTDAEKEWWEKRRSKLRADFMQELDEEEAAGSKAVTSTPATPARKSHAGSSDEDAPVMVEAGGPEEE
jgi:translocation protein SEC66